MQTNCGLFNVEIRDGAGCLRKTWASPTLAHLFQIEKECVEHFTQIWNKRKINSHQINFSNHSISPQKMPPNSFIQLSLKSRFVFFFRCQCNCFDSPSMELCRDKQEKKSCFEIKTAESNRQPLISCVRETTFTYLYDIICITINWITLLEMS